MTWDELPVGTVVVPYSNHCFVKLSKRDTLVLNRDEIRVNTTGLMSRLEEFDPDNFNEVGHFPQEFFE